MVWTIRWPDQKTYFKIQISRNSQISFWKPNYFSRQAIPKVMGALDSVNKGEFWLWFWNDLNIFLTRWKRPIFKTLLSQFMRNIRKFPYERIAFFVAKQHQIVFVLHSTYPRNTPYRVWFGLDNSLTRSKKPIFKIQISRNSQTSLWKPNYFPRQAIPKAICALDSVYTWELWLWVGIDLNNFLTRWKNLFLKFYNRNLFERIANFRSKKKTFFLDKQ